MSILVFGDAIVGVAWALRYKNITMNLKSDLKNQIFNEYDTNIEIRVNIDQFLVIIDLCFFWVLIKIIINNYPYRMSGMISKSIGIAVVLMVQPIIMYRHGPYVFFHYQNPSI